jgi:hypothetical protein
VSGRDSEPGGRDEVLRELRELSERVSTLQTEVRRIGSALPDPEPGWQDEPRPGEVASYAWLHRFEPPARRRPGALPRIVLEASFLVAAAVLAALAELEPRVIAAVMAGAWLLVALAEWAATRADRREWELMLAPPPAARVPAPADAAWFSPPVEQTLLERAAPAEPETAVARLPPVADEATVERRPT